MVTEEEEEKVDRGERVAIYAIKSAPQNCGVGGDGTPLPSGGLCVIQGIDPPFGLNALFRSFFCSPSSLCPVGWPEEGEQKKSLFKSHGGEKSATSRDDVTRFSPHACTRDAPLMRACVIWRFSISDKRELSRRQHPPDATVVASRVLEWISFLLLLLLLLRLSFPPSSLLRREIFICSYSRQSLARTYKKYITAAAKRTHARTHALFDLQFCSESR